MHATMMGSVIKVSLATKAERECQSNDAYSIFNKLQVIFHFTMQLIATLNEIGI